MYDFTIFDSEIFLPFYDPAPQSLNALLQFLTVTHTFTALIGVIDSKFCHLIFFQITCENR